MKYIQPKNIWQGECPICGLNSYFPISWTNNFLDGNTVDVVECPGSHPFFIVTPTNYNKESVRYVAPVSGDVDTPSWLPDEYLNAYSEMIFDFKSKKYRSAVSIAGIILDAHVNSLLRNPGDKRKPLAKRMEILSTRGQMDNDHFAEGTVGRIGRNEVVHPEDISNEIEEKDAKEAIDSVIGCLERYYKFRRAKALPAPTEQVGEAEGEAPKE